MNKQQRTEEWAAEVDNKHDASPDSSQVPDQVGVVDSKMETAGNQGQGDGGDLHHHNDRGELGGVGEHLQGAAQDRDQGHRQESVLE